MQSTQNVHGNCDEQLIWKIEAHLSALKSEISISITDTRPNTHQGSHMSWKSWKSPGFFFALEKPLKSFQISQLSWKLSAIPGNFRILLQLQCLCMYKALILFLIHQC